MRAALYIGLGGVALLTAGAAYAAFRRNEGENVIGGDPDVPDSDIEAPIGEAYDIEGMARMFASEAPKPKYTDSERIAIGWCALNWARHIKKTIAAIMLPPHHQKGHWCSTFQSPTSTDTMLATAILRSQYTDPTGGAISFFEPAQQDACAKTGCAGVTKTAEEIRKKWASEGLTLTVKVGRWEFYRKG